jgi:hypothetical protein
MAVPNIFGTATAAIPLSQLDTNFATAITLGNTAVYLGNTTTSLGNLTLTNVTISSGNVTLTGANVTGTANISILQVTSNVSVGGNVAVSGNISALNGFVTIGNTTVGLGNTATSIGNLTVTNTLVTEMRETANVSATAATGTINYDALTQVVLYFTTNASGNFTVNFRGNSGTSLDSVMSTGQSLSATFLVTNGATAYYNSAVQVDGSSVTPKWQGGSAPTSGNASSIDSYTYVIIKTGSATFTVLASVTKFA